MKFFFKKNFPFLINLYKQYKYNKILINVNGTDFNKNALLSYITDPFSNKSLSHTKYFEAQTLLKIISELEYNIDVIHFESSKNINFEKYSLICGFGDVFQKYFESGYVNIKTFYYGAGMHVCFQNTATLKRLKDVYIKKGIWLGKSTRFVEKTWSHQTTLVDGIVALGNDTCANSYGKYYDGNIFSLPAPFYNTQNAIEIINNRSKESRVHFLWFGSSGLIHKGLDLLLDYFIQRQDIVLHICGPIINEPDFINIYKNELYNTGNIINHGFIDINSDAFTDILTLCSFTIYPSCSEGGAPAVLTVIGNGGLIPIISKWTTVSTGHEIQINSLNLDGIDNAINKALSLSYEEIKILQFKNYEYVIKYHSVEEYARKLKLFIIDIVAT